MTDLQHPNLVRLMGIHIDSAIPDKPIICLVTEFMSKVSVNPILVPAMLLYSL